MKFKSCAKWPRSVFTGRYGNCISIDGHDTYEQADAVCDQLRTWGFGGNLSDFPIKTWVEPVIDGAVIRKVCGKLLLFERSPRVPGLKKYFIAHEDGRVLEDFKKWKPAVQWAKSQPEGKTKGDNDES